MNDLAVQLGIRSPKLRHILSHWLDSRTDRLMPRCQDIRPAKIKAELPLVWQYRYDSVQDEFIGGFAGAQIERLIGRPIKNACFRHLHPGDLHLFARAKRVLSDPAIFYGHGPLFKQRERQSIGERIILPFSDAGGAAAGIFGATDYSYSFSYKDGPDACEEIEQWRPITEPFGYAHKQTSNGLTLPAAARR